MTAKALLNWELVKVQSLEWQQDQSGIYTLIHSTPQGVRVDIMRAEDDYPLRSYMGRAGDVRKQLARDWEDLSLEHSAYIGFELARAELLRSNYVQD